MAKYAVYICGPGDCPHDPAFIHENLMGPACVPKSMSLTTGRCKTHRQRKIGNRYWWNGGCDSVLLGVFALLGLEPLLPAGADKHRIVLEMTRSAGKT